MRTSLVVGFVCSGLAMIAAPLAAQAQSTIRACVNPAGQMRLVAASEACRPQESLVVWSAQAQQEPGSVGGEGPVMLLDANDQPIGRMVTPWSVLLRAPDGTALAPNISRDGFVGEVGSPLWTPHFESADCSGTPITRIGWVVGGATPLMDFVGRTTDGRYAYPDRVTPPVSTTLRSYGYMWRDPGETTATFRCQTIAPQTYVTYPLKYVDLSTFVAPFKVQ